jgi:hypothetical protein
LKHPVLKLSGKFDAIKLVLSSSFDVDMCNNVRSRGCHQGMVKRFVSIKAFNSVAFGSVLLEKVRYIFVIRGLGARVYCEGTTFSPSCQIQLRLIVHLCSCLLTNHERVADYKMTLR